MVSVHSSCQKQLTWKNYETITGKNKQKLQKNSKNPENNGL